MRQAVIFVHELSMNNLGSTQIVLVYDIAIICFVNGIVDRDEQLSIANLVF
jgi:hypothetical protein